MLGMLYVFGLVTAFAAIWFVVAALQTFADAEPARLQNWVIAVVMAALSAACFWLAQRARREATR